MSDNRPIGVFDSGLGGLTAVKELRRLLPGEDIVYFGDTSRVPYGTRGRDTIIGYTRQDIAFLLSKNVKTILAACGTVSSTFPAEESSRLPVLYNGVVQAAAKAAVQTTRNGKIGIIGTEATIASKSYQLALNQLSPDIQSISNACPLFVPLVENGHFGADDSMAQIAAEEYLAPISAAGVDTLILGCTHYPLLSDTIQRLMGPSVTLIDPGKQAALALQQTLSAHQLLAAQSPQPGSTTFYVSDDPARFGKLASVFLGQKENGRVERINIEAYHL